MSVPDVGHSESPSHPHSAWLEAQETDWPLPAITSAHVATHGPPAVFTPWLLVARARSCGVGGGGEVGGVGGCGGGTEGGGAEVTAVTTSPPATPSNGRRLLLWVTETVTFCAEVSPTLAPEMLTIAAVGGDSHSRYTRIRPDEAASACARTNGASHWPAAPVYVQAKRAG